MSFQPQVPLTGIAGWKFLERTQASQQKAFESAPQIKRDLEYFAKNIGAVETAADLVADRRLLKVALGAFGLEGEIDKKAFIRKILEGGTDDATSLANRLTNSAMKDFANAFGFGNAGGSQIGESDFTAKIVASYKTRQFESAVGATNNDMRLVLNFKREIAELAKGTGSSWYNVLGSKPLRTVFETAFNLPAEFVKLDVDKQREIIVGRAEKLLGSDKITAFADPENVDKLITRFLAMSQIKEGAATSSRAATALSLIQNFNSGSQGLANLLSARG